MTQNIPAPITVLRGHTDAVNALSFVSEFILASGSGDGEVKLWDLRTRRAAITKKAHSHSILSISSLHRSSQLVTSGRDGRVRVWSAECWSEPIMSMETGVKHFCGTATDSTHADVHSVVTPSVMEDQVLIWDLRAASLPVMILSPSPTPTPSQKSQYLASPARKGMVTSLLYSSSSSASASASFCSSSHTSGYPHIPASVREEGQELSPSTLSSCASGVVYTGYESGVVTCTDLRSSKVIASAQPHKEPVLTMDMNPVPGPERTSGQHDEEDPVDRVVSGGADDTVNQLLMTTRESHCSSSSGDAGTGVSDADEAGGESVSQETSPHRLDVTHTISVPTPGVGAVRYRCDGKLIVTANWDSTVRIYSSKRMKPLAILRHHRESVYAIDYGMPNTSTASYFASGSKDSTVALW
eukprot:CAMPEP_0182426864 /NCGR_PEP_ID=MMETSP1167-20130531/13382_1 /TAXON_ID=2988 /ORGANISM="Mallomonas Sp, Strain CCMP3275" /LENGTH=412 /DNA_ID=CAMNT_0024608593 /DNA_START=14 /DNA_END=1249 /DNA_ORIENTATION=-